MRRLDNVIIRYYSIRIHKFVAPALSLSCFQCWCCPKFIAVMKVLFGLILFISADVLYYTIHFWCNTVRPHPCPTQWTPSSIYPGKVILILMAMFAHLLSIFSCQFSHLQVPRFPAPTFFLKSWILWSFSDKPILLSLIPDAMLQQSTQ
jgi:hypothetical protein